MPSTSDTCFSEAKMEKPIRKLIKLGAKNLPHLLIHNLAAYNWEKNLSMQAASCKIIKTILQSEIDICQNNVSIISGFLVSSCINWHISFIISLFSILYILSCSLKSRPPGDWHTTSQAGFISKAPYQMTFSTPKCNVMMATTILRMLLEWVRRRMVTVF